MYLSVIHYSIFVVSFFLVHHFGCVYRVVLSIMPVCATELMAKVSINLKTIKLNMPNVSERNKNTFAKKLFGALVCSVPLFVMERCVLTGQRACKYPPSCVRTSNNICIYLMYACMYLYVYIIHVVRKYSYTFSLYILHSCVTMYFVS